MPWLMAIVGGFFGAFVVGPCTAAVAGNPDYWWVGSIFGGMLGAAIGAGTAIQQQEKKRLEDAQRAYYESQLRKDDK